MSYIPNESSSNWFKTVPPAEDDEETEDPWASLTIGDLQKLRSGSMLGSIDYTKSISLPAPSTVLT